MKRRRRRSLPEGCLPPAGLVFALVFRRPISRLTQLTPEDLPRAIPAMLGIIREEPSSGVPPSFANGYWNRAAVEAMTKSW